MKPITYSVFTASAGRTLGKTVSWDGSKLVKSQQASAAGCIVRRMSAATLTEFIAQTAALSEREAVALGVSEHEAANVFAKNALPAPDGVGKYVARTKEFFHWADGPGLIYLDYDPRSGCTPLGDVELVALLREAIPAFARATIVHKASSSSFLRAPDGSELSGLRGQHLFVLVRNARAIPDLVRRVVDRLWLSGHGRYDVSASGSLLERTLFDISVWQPERLIFTRAASFGGIRQNLPPPKVFPGDLDELFDEEFPLDEERLAPLCEDEAERVAQLKALAKSTVREEATVVRDTWLKSRVEVAVARSPTVADRDQVRASMRTALEAGYLPADLILYSERGEQVSVREILADPDRWHERRFADPLESDYGNDSRIAVAFLKDTSVPSLYSHAHGGTNHRLIDNRSQPEDFDDLTLPGSSLVSVVKRFQVLQAGNFAAAQPPSWIIKNVLPDQALCMIYGPSGSGKSFVTLDMLWAIANGERWAGHATKQCRVIYIAAEGKAGLRLRLRAFEEARGILLSDLSFGIISDTPDLRTADVVSLMKEIEAHGGADVVVIDTFAQATSGADENSAQDMGPALKKCTEMIDRLGVSVILVHHSGKDAARGSRGWSGIKAALDTEFRVERHDGHSSITITKQKDGPEGETIYFELQAVELGHDTDGDPISSCVVHLRDASSVIKSEPKGKWQARLYTMLARMEGFGEVSVDALIKAVLTAHAADNPEEPQVRKDALLRSLRLLAERGRVLLEGCIVSSTNTTKSHNV